jgi:hypothetical protein
VNQYTGDGIMALFGAPIAHEDHAQRACLAVLHLREALRAYADELRRTHAVSFAARMGLNSGEVVVGKICDDLRMDYTAQGHTVGLALRGDSEGGLRLIEESLTQVARPGREERYCLAEILRLKGWMRARQGDLDGAEQNYRASLDWARQQQAKSWELRTATSLARLWQQQGKRTEAHQMLSESQRTPREAGGLLGWAVSKTAMIG